LGEGPTTELTILRRILAYAGKVLGWKALLDGVTDRRRRPLIPTGRIIGALVGMFLCRLGSLNALAHGKEVMAALKDEGRDLLKDARALFAETAPTRIDRRGRVCQCWDIEGFTSWPQVHAPVRVVGGLETWTVRRQLDDQRESLTSDWLWVTTLNKARASTATVVDLGHGRWTIENQGFNEMVNRRHADHVYKHDPLAIEVAWLLAMLCLTVFLAFWRRDLKPALRATVSMLHIARRITAELIAAIPAGPARVPV